MAMLVGNPEVKERMGDWGVSDMLELVTAKFPDFATRSELCHRITTNLPGYVPPPDTKEELTRKQTVDVHSTSSIWQCQSREVAVVKACWYRSSDVYVSMYVVCVTCMYSLHM